MSKPILAFHPRGIEKIPAGRPTHITDCHIPEHDNQVARVEPQLLALRDALDRHKVSIQADIQGLEPEFVLVFEIVGRRSDFYKAAEKAGMEWMFDVDSVQPADDDFYELDKDRLRSDKDVHEKLYLTMTNQRSMDQLLSLWDKYSHNENFDYGYAVFKDVFSHLRSVRRWEASDRLEETTVSALNRILEEESEGIRFEIELWYRQDEAKRKNQRDYVASVIKDCRGKVVNETIYSSIGFHGIIAECPSDEVRRMIADSGYPLLVLDAVKFIKPSGQTASRITNPTDIKDSQSCDDANPTKDPVIALFDGLPLANHALLANRIIINDPDDFESSYTANQRQHGTGMSSLIIHGDLHNKFAALDSYLYVRPIMRPDKYGYESVPSNRLFVDILRQAVMEIVNEPTLSTIRIINISIGDSTKPFVYALSPVAKMLDYLSEKYNLLFIVSAGNNLDYIETQYTKQQFCGLAVEQKQKAVYENVWNTLQNRKILSPSESINAVTVAGSYSDYAQPPYYGHQLPIVEGYPAPYSRIGPGYKNAIKPDMINNGGRLGYSFSSIMDDDPAELKVVITNSSSGVGQGVASPNTPTAQINTCGTSNATALTSRLCAEYLNVLRSNELLSIPNNYEAIALKAMLIHSCSWGVIGQDLMNNYVPNVPRRKRAETLKWVGYGYPDKDFSSFCTDQRVTVMGYGELNSGQQTKFSFPLPDCLIAEAVKKKLTITLAWMSPIAPKNKNYKLADLLFSADNHKLIAEKRENSDENTSRRGTVQHEVFEGKTASTYVSGSNVEIVVQCKKSSTTQSPVKFVLMATLEVAPEYNLPIYQEVEALVRAQVRISQ